MDTKCVVCDGELFRQRTTTGDAQQQGMLIWDGFYCDNCGLSYAKLPKANKKTEAK